MPKPQVTLSDSDSDTSPPPSIADQPSKLTREAAKNSRVIVESGSDSGDSGDDDFRPEKSARKRGRKPVSKRTKKVKTRFNDSSSDGEISSSENESEEEISPKRQAKQNSDSEVSDDSEDDLTEEQLNAKFRAEMDTTGLTEMQIEEALFDMHNKHAAARERRKIRKKLAAKQNLEKKDSLSRRELENKKAKKSALQNLKDQRDRLKNKESKPQKPVDVEQVFKDYSSDSASSDSDQHDTSTRRFEPRKEENVIRPIVYIDTKEDLEKIKLSRDRIAKWVHMPFFANAVKGCFVRISIGTNPETQKDIYRICEVVEVCETQKTYVISCNNAKHNTMTNKGAKLRYGNAERIYRFEYISNQPFTEQEFAKWKSTATENNIQLPTLDQIKDKVKELESALRYNLNDAEIEDMLKEKQKFRKNPFNYAKKKSCLEKDLSLAEEAGDIGRVGELKEELVELECRAKELDFRRSQTVLGIKNINEKNRLENIKIAEATMRLSAKDREERLRDPFHRRYGNTGVTGKKEPEPEPEPEKVEEKPAALDYGFDDIDLSGIDLPSASIPAIVPKPSPMTKSSSLNLISLTSRAYKEANGLI